MKYYFKKFSLLSFTILFVFLYNNLFSQSEGDYRTREGASGNWSANNIWQKYQSGSWTDVITYPTYTDGAIEIRNDANITTDITLTIDQLTVNGTLTINSNFTINNGSGDDMTISNDGTVNWESGNMTLNSGPATLIINGTFDIKENAGIFTGQTGGTTINGTLKYRKSVSTSYPNYNGSSGYSNDYTTYGSNGTCEILSYNTANYCQDFAFYESFQNFTFNATNAGSYYYSIFTSNTTIAGKLKVENTSSTSGKGFILSNTTERQAGSLEIIGGTSYVLMSEAGASRTFTSNGNVTISGGTLIIAEKSGYTGTLNCKGNFTHTGGTITRTNGTANIVFNGTSTQEIESIGTNGTLTITFSNNVTIPSGKTFTISSYCTFQGTSGYTLTVYGTLEHKGNVPNPMDGSGVLKNGANYIHNTNSASSRMITFFSTKENNSNWIYRGSSSLTPAVSLAGTTFGNLSFESTSGTWSATFTGSNGFAVNGNFTLGTGVTLNTTNTGTSIVKGNFTINGTLSIQSGNTFSFSGTSAQTISGTSDITFDNVTINNSNGVYLDTNIIVDTLTLTSGILYTGTSSPYNQNKITFKTTANNPVESLSSRIVGKAEMSARSVGTGGINFLNCNIASGSDNIGNVSILRKTGECGIVTHNGNQSIACQWLVTVTNQPTNGREVTYSWLSALDNGKNFSATNKAEVWISENGIDWEQIGDSADVSVSDPRAITVNTTNFSYWVASSKDAPLPVELLSFNFSIKDRNVILKWITTSEENNSGFDIERTTIPEEKWGKIGFIFGKGTTKNLTYYEFTDKNLNPGKYKYRLKQIDYNGNYRFYLLNDIVEIHLPQKLELAQNYPNPFNNNTIISIVCPIEEHIKLKVYDITGRELQTLNDGILKPGTYQFNVNGSNLTSGIYFYILTAGETRIIKKMVLIK